MARRASPVRIRTLIKIMRIMKSPCRSLDHARSHRIRMRRKHPECMFEDHLTIVAT